MQKQRELIQNKILARSLLGKHPSPFSRLLRRLQLRLDLGRKKGIGHCEKTWTGEDDTSGKVMKWPQLRLKLEREEGLLFASQHQMRRRRSSLSPPLSSPPSPPSSPLSSSSRSPSSPVAADTLAAAKSPAHSLSSRFLFILAHLIFTWPKSVPFYELKVVLLFMSMSNFF